MSTVFHRPMVRAQTKQISCNHSFFVSRYLHYAVVIIWLSRRSLLLAIRPFFLVLIRLLLKYDSGIFYVWHFVRRHNAFSGGICDDKWRLQLDVQYIIISIVRTYVRVDICFAGFAAVWCSWMMTLKEPTSISRMKICQCHMWVASLSSDELCILHYIVSFVVLFIRFAVLCSPACDTCLRHFRKKRTTIINELAFSSPV